jgi:pimeloyl-ACP methyl ester carboxylesterase
LNGLLIDQADCWYRNLRFWQHSFDVHAPNLLIYDGPNLHERIDEGLPISVDYLVEQLHLYLQTFVQASSIHLVASSLGAKVAVEYALRYPDQVARLVLLGPSGLGGEERLPFLQGVSRSDVGGVLQSIFHDPNTLRSADPRAVGVYERRFADRRWRTGLLRTIRGTMAHCVREQLARVTQPTLVVSGREDRIVDPVRAEEGAGLLPQGWFLSLPRCGHAPQVENPELINPLVVDFLTGPRPGGPLLTGLLQGQQGRPS